MATEATITVLGRDVAALQSAVDWQREDLAKVIANNPAPRVKALAEFSLESNYRAQRVIDRACNALSDEDGGL